MPSKPVLPDQSTPAALVKVPLEATSLSQLLVQLLALMSVARQVARFRLPSRGRVLGLQTILSQESSLWPCHTLTARCGPRGSQDRCGCIAGRRCTGEQPNSGQRQIPSCRHGRRAWSRMPRGGRSHCRPYHIGRCHTSPNTTHIRFRSCHKGRCCFRSFP